MGLKLSFTVHPPTPYHTIDFHINRGIKQKWHNPKINTNEVPYLISEVLEKLKIITQLPDHFSVCIWPSKVHLLSVMNPLFNRNIIILPGENSTISLIQPGYINRYLFDKAVNQNQIEDIKFVKRNSIVYGQDIDLITGRKLDFQSITSIKSMNPELFLFFDVSSSFVNFSFNYEKIDAYIFSTDHVLGLFPGVTILLIKTTLLDNLRNHMGKLFYTYDQNKFKKVQGDVYCHQEVDLLKLFVFKELCQDLIRRDLIIIKNEIIYKSIILYNVLEASTYFKFLVDNKNNRSPNVLCAQILGSVSHLKEFLQEKGILLDYLTSDDYGQIVRIGNFPVHSKEQITYLADIIESV